MGGRSGEGYTDDGARFWVEEGFAHSGTRCIGAEVFDITKSRRVEFNIMDIDTLLGNHWFISSYLYFPSDFSLDSPTNKWMTLANPYAQMGEEGTWRPAPRIALFQRSDGSWDLLFTIKYAGDDKARVSGQLTGIAAGDIVALKINRDCDGTDTVDADVESLLFYAEYR